MTPLQRLNDWNRIIQSKQHYSDWHRPQQSGLPAWCKLADGDWWEVRNIGGTDIPVACMETMEIGGLFLKEAQSMYELWGTKTATLKFIVNALNIPVYVVRHTSDCKLFSVARLNPDGTESLARVMDEFEYKELLINLGVKQQ